MQYIEIRCFSGYIRNWKKLCGELNIDPTLSRAEREEALLIAAYQKWQMKMMEHLYGMFAFAVWDANAQKLFVVRDPEQAHAPAISVLRLSHRRRDLL